MESSLSKLEEDEVGEILWIGPIAKIGIWLQILALNLVNSDGSRNGIVFQITPEEVVRSCILWTSFVDWEISEKAEIGKSLYLKGWRFGTSSSMNP